MRDQAISKLLYRELDKIRQAGDMTPEARVVALNNVLQQMLVERTQRERLYFATLFARMSYACQEYQIKGALQYHLHGLRKRLKDYLSGKAEVPEMLESESLPVLVQAIEAFYGFQPPESLYAYRKFVLRLDRGERRVKGYKPALRVVALGDQPLEEILLARDEERPEETVRIRYNLADRNENFNTTLEVIRKVFGFPVTLQLLDVDIHESGDYAPRGIVIEPDYLLDVTAVAECFRPEGKTDPYSFLLKKYLPFVASPPLLLGHIANFFLDELMSDTGKNFKQIFPRVFQLNPLAFSLLGNSEVREIMQKSQLHFINLLRVIREDFPAEGIEPEKSFLEPTFYSNTYGLQGRLDVLYRDEAKAAIVELKSGKPFRPNKYGLSANHFTQTLLYDLLIRDAFGKEADPRNFILYSGLEMKNLFYAPRIRSQQFDAVQLRNQLLAFEQLLANTYANDPQKPIEQSAAFRLFHKLKPASFPHFTGFTRRDLSTFETVFQQLDALEKKYFSAFSGFIAREHLLAKTGLQGTAGRNGQASLWLNSQAEKEDAFDLLAGLELIENRASDEPPLLYFRRTEKTNPLANFRVGDIGVLYPAGEGIGPLDNQLFKCSLVELSPEKISVRLRSQQFNQKIFNDFPHWNLEHDLIDSSFIHLYRSLFAFAGLPSAKRQLLMAQTPPGKASSLNIPHREGLTAEQSQLLNQMLGAPDYFLLWGPPGTGKTSVMLRHAVEWLWQSTDEHILLLAYTNRAVDEICESIERIDPDIRKHYIRIGSSFSTAPPYQDQLLDQKIRGLPSRKDIKTLIRNHRIFVGTLASFMGKKDLLQLHPFDRVIIDEASQILEPALLGLLGAFKRFILIGDHKQLPAVVTQDEWSSQVSDPELQGIGLQNMRNSYFERLFKRCMDEGWDWAYAKLSFQGRMHQDIMAFPNEYFYEGQLAILPQSIRANGRQTNPLVYELPAEADELSQLIASRRLLFIPTGSDDQSGNLKTNREEAQLIARLVKAFFQLYRNNQRAIQKDTIGIITPYRAQIAQIQEVLNQEGIDLDLLTIDTVERYQGGARDIILLSLCTNALHQLESLISLSEDGIDRKLNVALTRAREHIVIVGNPELLTHDPTYRALINKGIP